MNVLYSFDYYTESWIEVSSQPSSSSLSSAATDEIVTTGLRVQHDPNARRRRRLDPTRPDLPARPVSAADSSQEEYEESESESDRLLSSSNEDLQPHFSHNSSSPAPPSTTSEDPSIEEEDDDDGNSTALGVTSTEPAFTPQPNAFSHPPISQAMRQNRSTAVSNSYFPSPRPSTGRSVEQRLPSSSQRPRSHTPYSLISPSHQVDHDAALRASLSTLLSCAAAARGLPKRDQVTHENVGPSTRIEPSTIRMLPESALTGEEPIPHRRLIPRRSSASSSSALSMQEKGKRKSTSKDRREIKKKRKGNVDEMTISPTLMTWVVSAGVVVLFSAISFSAGFAYGKEVGALEAGVGTTGDVSSYGKDVGRGLRRLRWGSTSAVVRT
ncbi:hypothetical protein MMC20_001381 [Loxospora ochrophaea]|nr:hypothetical protein [Loxospora ochrophaea]